MGHAFMTWPDISALPENFAAKFDRAMRRLSSIEPIKSSAPVELDDRPMGEGKTEDMLRFIAELDEGLICIFERTTQMAAQARDRLVALGVARSETEVYVGQTQNDPETGRPICAYVDQAKLVAAAGGKPRQLCARVNKRRKQTCPHYAECAYQKKLRAKPKYWFMTHAMLPLALPRKSKGPVVLVVIDEDPGPTLRTTRQFRAADLVGLRLSKINVEASRDALPGGDRPSDGAYEDGFRYNYEGGGGNAAAREFAKKTIDRVMQAIDNAIKVEDGVLRIKLRELPYPGDLMETRRLLWKLHQKVEVSPDPNQVDLARVEKLSGRNRKVRQACSLLKALADASALADNEFANGVFIQSDGDGKPVITAPEFKELHTDYHVPVMLLSASAEPSLLAHHWTGLEGVEKQVPVARYFDHARVIRVLDTMSKRSLIGDGGAELTPKGRKLRCLIEVKAWEHRDKGQFVEDQRVDILVVAQKAVVEQLREVGLPPNVDTAHFNAVEGKDQWRGVACVLIVGRPLPPPVLLLPMAERVSGRNLRCDRWYAKHPAVVPLVDRETGKVLAGPAFEAEYGIEDPIFAAVLRTTCDAAVLQADRSRALRRLENNPVEIIFLNDLDLTSYAFDEVINWSDMAPWHQVMAARGLALGPAASKGKNAVIAAAIPDQFVDAKAVENAFRGRGGLIPDPPFRHAVYGGLKLPGARYAVPMHFDALTISTARRIVQERFGSEAHLSANHAPIQEMLGEPHRSEPSAMFGMAQQIPPPCEFTINSPNGPKPITGGTIQWQARSTRLQPTS